MKTQGKHWKLIPIQVDVRTMLDEENALRNQQMDTVEASLDENCFVLQDGLVYAIQGNETYLSSARDWVLQNELRSFWLVEPELDIFEDMSLISDHYFRLLNPKLEILGDTALLTYHYYSSGFSDSGLFSNSGKVTSVWGRRDGKMARTSPPQYAQ